MRIASAILGSLVPDDSKNSVVAGRDLTPRPLNYSRDCFDPTACNNDCTGMGQMFSAAEACTDAMLNTFASYLGRNTREVTPRRDVVSYPHPDNFREDGGDNLGACFESNTAQSPACALILCESAKLAVAANTTCGCEGASSFRVETKTLCSLVRCVDGSAPNPASCECAASGDASAAEPGRPEPRPELWLLPGSQTSLRWNLLDRSFGSFAYDHSKDPQTLNDTFGKLIWLE